jgi:hypothetical protein
MGMMTYLVSYILAKGPEVIKASIETDLSVAFGVTMFPPYAFYENVGD